MNLAQRATTAVKARLAQMLFPRGYGGWGRFDNLTDPWWSRGGCAYAPTTAGDYDPVRAAGDISTNTVVAICLGWVAENIPQARLQVRAEGEGGVWTPVPKHPLVDLIRRPNGYYGTSELLGATAADYLTDGNAAWLKIRDRGSTVRELWWLPRHMWKAEPSKDGRTFIQRYVYTVEGTEYELDPNDVVHFRFPRLDPADQRMGISPLKHCLREIGLDNGISNINGALVAQGGMPGVIIAPKIRPEDPEMGEGDAEKVRLLYQDKFAGTGAGRAMVLTFDAVLHKPVFSPEEMKLDVIGHRPEARICAALRIQASAVGLSVGEAQRTYANLKEARDGSWEECIIPMAARLAENLTRQLLPDFDGETGREVGWDYSEVRALREDEDAKSKRAIEEFNADGITWNEFREKLCQPKIKDDRGDLYRSELAAQRAIAAQVPDERDPALPPPSDDAPESRGDAAARNGRKPEVVEA